MASVNSLKDEDVKVGFEKKKNNKRQHADMECTGIFCCFFNNKKYIYFT